MAHIVKERCSKSNSTQEPDKKIKRCRVFTLETKFLFVDLRANDKTLAAQTTLQLACFDREPMQSA
jgi:hypothetical protein